MARKESYRRKVPSRADGFGQPPTLDQITPELATRGDLFFYNGTQFFHVRRTDGSAPQTGDVVIMTNGIPTFKTLSDAGIAPNDADYLVGTSDAGLTNEIVVGTAPGGELGGTWASPTVDTTHSGSAHTDFIAKAFVDAKGDLISASAADTPAILTVGANDTILMADSAQAAGLKWAAPATPSTQALGDAAAEGTGDTFTRGDHKHAMPAAASTTDVLTGTDTADAVTADALAALWEKGGDIASADPLSVGEGGFFHITGTTTITDIDFATDKTGRKVILVFDGALTLTHNATTLILPTGANITTAAGDTACFVSEGTDAVRCVWYMRKDGTAVGGGSGGDSGSVNGTALTDFDLDDDEPAAPADGINVKWQVDTSVAPDNVSAYLDLDDVGILQNEVMNFPSLEGADDAQPEWWEEENANITLTEVDVAGETITETFERCLKVVTTANTEYAYQRLTYADQPRVKSGRTLSMVAKVWSVSSAAARIRLATSAATTVVSGDTTAASWTTLRANNLTLDGTYVDIQLEVDTGTAYFAEITVMIGARAFTLGPRGLNFRWRDATEVKSLAGLGDEATWTDVDCTSATSPLAAIVKLFSRLAEGDDATVFGLYVRRNGSSEANNDGLTMVDETSGATTGLTSERANNDFDVILDDQQIFEYYLDRIAGASTLDGGGFAVRGWWEWE